MTGLGMTMVRAPVEPGSSVAIFGSGPIGLAAIQGSRIKWDASHIIAVEPDQVSPRPRHESGRHGVLDPNDFSDSAGLIARIREMTDGSDGSPVCRRPQPDGSRARLHHRSGRRRTIRPPGSKRYSREPHGNRSAALSVYTLCPAGGVMRTCGVGHPTGLDGDIRRRHLVEQQQESRARQPRRCADEARSAAVGRASSKPVSSMAPRWWAWRCRSTGGARRSEAAAYRTAITGIVTFT
jgi:threonine dehydrogenase-like Zn-dependent dehydrogenase